MARTLVLPTSESQRSSALPGFRVSWVVAAGVCAGFLWSARVEPLPGVGWAAAFLLLAVEHDVRSLRIPNWLTHGGVAWALLLSLAFDGLPGLLQALSGAVVAFCVLFLPFVARWLGAGDVKAVMALGALWGPEPVLPVLFWILVAGGSLGFALLVASGELADLGRRWWRSLRVTLATLHPTYYPAAAGSTARSGLPFAVAIGVGASMYQLWGFPWA